MIAGSELSMLSSVSLHELHAGAAGFCEVDDSNEKQKKSCEIIG